MTQPADRMSESDAEQRTRERWDGAVRCILCAGTHHDDAHEWCAAAEALVCDPCCTEMLNGEPRRMIAALQASTGPVSPLDVISACSECARLPRMLIAEADFASSDDEEPGSIH